MATVAEAIALTLAEYDTERYFCVTGGDHDLWLAVDEAGIDIVNCRSEAAATYMADGYARVAGRPGFVYGQRGPGAANVAAALADAYWAHSPVVSLTTAIAAATRDRFQYQDVDTMQLHAPVTGWSATLSAPARAADLLRAAIRAATGPVPGPTHLEIPADLLAQAAGNDTVYREAEAGVVGAIRLAPERAAVTALVDRLLAAERPLLLAGAGTVISGASPELATVAETLKAPVVTTMGGKGAIAEDSVYAVGVGGRYSRRIANEVIADCDVVLALGTRLGGLATHAWQLPFGEKRILQVDADPRVLGHNYRAEVAVAGDVRLTLQCVIAELEERSVDAGPSEWLESVQKRVATWRAHADRLAEATPEDGIHPARVIRELQAAMAPDDRLVADTGGIGAWAGTLFDVRAGRNFIRSAGSLGWAFPAALGAKLADPQRGTVCLIGDGGLLYHVGELETAVRRGISVTVVVLNNRAFASEHHLLKNLWRRELSKITDFHDVDFAAVARGFGVDGVTVDDAAGVGAALADALATDRPTLVDVRASKEAEAPAEPFRGEHPV